MTDPDSPADEAPRMRADLSGQIERITYANPDNGYTIAQLKVRGSRQTVTIVGNLMEPLPGEVMELQGRWKTHPRYGRQFEIENFKTTAPATVQGIKKYLGSGLIKGIGPKTAERIVDHFGKKTLDIIEEDIGRLEEIAGIGAKRVDMIRAAWAEQREIRSVMMFLQSHQVSAGFAVKIFKQYGDKSIEIVTANPYQLATDIRGIGFLSADRIAERLGFAKDSDVRIRAGILYVLFELADDGHVCCPWDVLIEKSREILEVDPVLVAAQLPRVAAEDRIVIETIADAPAAAADPRMVYLAHFYACETGIARIMRQLATTGKSIQEMDAEKAVAWVQTELAFTLAEKQVQAVVWAVRHKVMIITGGPGTGKTTIIRAILKIFSRLGVRIMLAAPTGRAAKQMSEATGHPASTIHRMLSYNFQKGGFQKNEKNPLACDLLVVDEASMIDTVLMYQLLRAVPSGATLILVGDVNQLPSVGAGQVLNDVIASGVAPVARLNEIFRQARQSRIIVNAHRINQGWLPEPAAEGAASDFYFIEQEAPERVLEIILELAARRIPRKFGFHPATDIQVLSPMHRGIVGTANLNIELQKTLNPKGEELVLGNVIYRNSDKVMQIRNNYDKGVFNGDIGRISRINRENREVIVNFDGRFVTYDFNEMDEVVPAYAVSVHKSQGSEYPAVIVPVLMQHYMLLQRNLIYTAVTRGRRLVVLVGTKKALAIAVKNDKTRQRYTRLMHRLKQVQL
jgi:exodeoxyribonuclease V alpha subunit